MLKEKLFKALLESLLWYKQGKIVKKATNVCNIYVSYTLKRLHMCNMRFEIDNETNRISMYDTGVIIAYLSRVQWPSSTTTAWTDRW